ncbi:hypothetical protein QLX08_008517 [Tetragonisca angustula]|uniref:Uncharacterized protein n=1 Tax=Tetragonisca angustula TaxID=166442 RepID=A0AAW0ZJM2_9HYME
MQNAEVSKIRPKFNLTLMNHGSSVETIGFPDETRENTTYIASSKRRLAVKAHSPLIEHDDHLNYKIERN